VRESIQIVIHYLPALLRALPTTLELLGLSVLIALFLGLLLAWGKISKNKPAKIFSSVFISFMRGTPMMVQVLLIFILIPTIAYQNGVDTSSWDPFMYALIAYSLNLSAFFAEIYRSAYNGMDYRQIEAAESLGMTKLQVFRRVTVPQGAVIALPNLTNMTLEQMKNTSIAAVIGVYDIVARAQQLARNNYGVGQMQLYLTVGLIFWGLCLLILFVMNKVTKRISRGMVPEKA
jgi:His/Glu/Gln/Arg/opine family amino acid ABC transporter permease subunit